MMTETATPPAMVDNDVPLAKLSVNGAVKQVGSNEDRVQSQSDRIPNPAMIKPMSYLCTMTVFPEKLLQSLSV
jgi:hypothetical protein